MFTIDSPVPAYGPQRAKNCFTCMHGARKGVDTDGLFAVHILEAMSMERIE